MRPNYLAAIVKKKRNYKSKKFDIFTDPKYPLNILALEEIVLFVFIQNQNQWKYL